MYLDNIPDDDGREKINKNYKLCRLSDSDSDSEEEFYEKEEFFEDW